MATKKRKWGVLYCSTCLRYSDSSSTSGYRRPCRCGVEYEEREAIPFNDELKLHSSGYNWALRWQSTTTGILYPMSLVVSFPLFHETVAGCVRKDWDWKNNGGVTKIFPAKKQIGTGGIFRA